VTLLGDRGFPLTPSFDDCAGFNPLPPGQSCFVDTTQRAACIVEASGKVRAGVNVFVATFPFSLVTQVPATK
jgi:hypothetical protein